MSLSPREKRFVNEYLSVLCAKTAALRAGYSPENARGKGSKILHRPAVAAALAEIEAPALARAGVTLDRLLQEAASIVFADIRQALRPDGTLKPLDEIDGATAAALSIEAAVSSDGRSYVKVRSHNKIAAMFLLARHVALKEGLRTGLLPDTRAGADLVGVEYGYNVRDELLLESKDSLKARGLASPDLADALALTFAQPVAPVAAAWSPPTDTYWPAPPTPKAPIMLPDNWEPYRNDDDDD